MKIRAFTLIELLIVVAIIAILAAIAIPNFVEAQTRAKVSAAQSDMRTVAFAIEAYAVDNERYPAEMGLVNGPAGSYTSPPLLNGHGTARLWEFKTSPTSLTTPIAYLTSLPLDPFKVGAVATIPPNTGLGFNTGNPLDAGYIYLDIASWTRFESPMFPSEWANSIFGRWGLVSLGPDKLYNPPNPMDINFLGWIYDPTNGTVSTGMLVRTQNQVQVK